MRICAITLEPTINRSLSPQVWNIKTKQHSQQSVECNSNLKGKNLPSPDLKQNVSV